MSAGGVARAGGGRAFAPRRHSRGGRGWTLVELAVVFVVIGVVAGAGAPRLIAMKRNARVKATSEELQIIGNIVSDYARRCPRAAGVTLPAFQVIGEFHPATAGECSPDPLDMISFMLPPTFDGLNPYDSPYMAKVTWLGGPDSDVKAWCCVPSDDFTGYVSSNGMVSAVCGDLDCPECTLRYDLHVVPTGAGREVVQEKRLTQPGLTPAQIAARALVGK